MTRVLEVLSIYSHFQMKESNNTPPPKGPKLQRPNNFVIFLIVALAIAGAVTLFSPYGNNTKTQDVTISELQQKYKNKEVQKVVIDGNKLVGEAADNQKYVATVPATLSITDVKDLGFLDDPEKMIISSVGLETKDRTTENRIINILAGLLPFVLLAIILLFVLRQAQGSANSAFSFGQSKARLNDKDKNKTTFADVAGAEEAKEELADVVDFLKSPKKYTKMGAKIPKGVLLFGPPGTGKTLLARAVAGEADVPFFSISGSEFVEMFVGVGASRVRDLFKKAKKFAPSIIFIDEIDAVGRQRGAGMGGGHDEREQTLNQILTEMDGFENDTSVIVIAGTNRPDILDSALLRPGRFDKRVVIDRPNVVEREEILKVHARKKPLTADVDMKTIAKKTPGFTGADLENLLNESAILAAKRSLKEISMGLVTEAIEKVTIGPERKSRRLSDEEKKITAYHELGHAVVGHMLPYCDPVHKISVVSRGMALGVTWFLPEEDVHLQSKIKFEQDICSLLGGRVAEEIFFGAELITTGASNDLERASELARKMVTEYGMSRKIGPMVLETRKNVFLGRDLGESKIYSDETAKIIDDEVRAILDNAYNTTKDIVTTYKDLIDEAATDLLKKEEINEEEFGEYFKKYNADVPVKPGLNKHIKGEAIA